MEGELLFFLEKLFLVVFLLLLIERVFFLKALPLAGALLVYFLGMLTA